MEPLTSFPQTELRLRTEVVLVELDRLHTDWAAGRSPSAAELAAVADDLAALRDTVEFSAVMAAFESPAYDEG
ncbi:hypothetical protein [Patulibacter sp.]|uniref:hypothetical protein n=1 Tax=Patulibacter sp. TaxID=1912859 RepID=UPI002726CAB6|nr:hypothetical protein [Patulibacter sp.]MDO9408464.1 hypothetical protein [Patulibacter sp.]